MGNLCVIFFRSMNLGHKGSPTRDQLEGLLRAAGAKFVRSFQTNGTVAIEPSGNNSAVDVAAVTLEGLRTEIGYSDAAFVRPIEPLADVVARQPFAGATDERTYRETITFFDGGKELSLKLPWTNPKDDVDIIELHEDYALSVIRKPKNTAGSPTAELESRLGVPATTRTMGTLERLVKALG